MLAIIIFIIVLLNVTKWHMLGGEERGGTPYQDINKNFLVRKLVDGFLCVQLYVKRMESPQLDTNTASYPLI